MTNPALNSIWYNILMLMHVQSYHTLKMGQLADISVPRGGIKVRWSVQFYCCLQVCHWNVCFVQFTVHYNSSD